MNEKENKFENFMREVAKIDARPPQWMTTATFVSLWTVFMAAAALEISLAFGYDPGISRFFKKSGIPAEKRKEAIPTAKDNGVFFNMSLLENQQTARNKGLWGFVKKANPQMNNYEIAKEIILRAGPSNLGNRGAPLKNYNRWREKDLRQTGNGKPVIFIQRKPVPLIR